MTDNQTIPEGLSRRDMLRRSAALGAALVVATPGVQSLGRVAAFASTSPPPTEASFPSHFQIMFTVTGSSTYYGIKWDGAWGLIGGPPQGSGSRCWDPETYRGAGYVDADDDQISIFRGKVGAIGTQVSDDGARGAFVFNPSQLNAIGVTIVDAATFDGQYSDGYSGKCQLSVTPGDDGAYRFWKPAA